MDKKIQGIKPRKSVSGASLTTTRSVQKHGNGSKSSRYKQAEKALLESEEKYKNLFEYAKDAIFLADTKTGIITDVNAAGSKLLGLPKKKIIGMHQSELHPPELVEDYKKVFKDHVRKEIVTNEYMIVQRADGKRIPVDISTSLITMGDRTVIQGIFRDVSERLKMESALKESEEKISKAFRSIPEAVSVATLKDGVFLEVNDSFLIHNGYSRDEVIGHTGKELSLWVKPGDRYRIKQLMEKYGHFDNEEFTLRRKTGELRTILLSADKISFGGQPCILTIGADITERKRAEEALRQSEEKYSSLVERSNDGIIIIEKGILRFVNTKMAEMTGFTVEEAVGRKFVDFTAPEEKQKLMNIHMKRMKGEDVPADYETTIIGHDGKRINTDISACMITYEGRPAVMVIIRDITDRKKAEQALMDEATRRKILIEQSSDGIVILDQDGKVYDANQRFADMLGYSLEEVRKLDVFDWSPPAPREPLLELIRTTDEKGEHFETQNLRKDGTIFDVEVSTNGAKFAGQKLIFCVCRDITERKKMEQAIRESEEKFSKAFHATPQQIIITRDRDDVTLEVNDTYTKATGYTREETVGKTSQELGVWTTPEDNKKLQQKLKNYGRITNEEFEFINKKRQKHTQLITIEPITISGEKCWLSVSTDITDRKRRENLQKGENHILMLISQGAELNEILDAIIRLCEQNDPSIKGSIMLYDASKNWLSGSGPSLSKEYNASMRAGIPAGQVAGSCGTAAYRKKRVIIPDIKKSPLFKPFKEAIELMSKNHLLAVWSEPIISSNGELLGTIANYSDHTGKPNDDNIRVLEWSARIAAVAIERKRIEQELKESEEKISKAFQAIPEAISISSMEDDVFLEVNDSFISFSGYSREEIIGHHTREVVHWVNPDDDYRMKQLREKRTHFANEEFLIQTKSGKTLTLLMSGDVINFGGKPCLLVVGNDITERKKIEQALRESEQKFSTAFQAMPEAVSIARLKDGAFIEVNDSFLKLNGYSKDEVIGRSGDILDNWVNSSERDQMVNTVKKQGHAENIECEIKTKTGEIRTVLMSADTINIGGEPCMLCIANDITERKMMEQALKESEEKFSKAFHAIPETLSISTLKEGRFLDVNDSFLKLNNLTREEVIGRTGTEIQLIKPGDERNKLREILEEQGRFTNVEIEFKAPKSKNILTFLFSADTIEIGGEPCLLIIGNDITKRKQAENKLQQAMDDLEQNSALLKATNKELESFSYSVSHDLRSPLRSIDGFSQALLEDYTGSLDEKAQDYLNRLRNASQKMGELIDGLLKLSRLTRSEMHHEKVDLSSLANEIANRLRETHDKRDVEFIIGNNLSATGDPQMLRVLLENLLGNAWKFTKNTQQSRIEFGSITENGAKTFFVKDNGAGFDMAFKDKLFGAFQRLHDTAEFPGTGIGLATVQRIINRHGGNIRAEGATDKGASFYFTLN
ncbi:MAG: PAS domain S-box protein [Dehalococcoidales bacterium]|nr:PAS domain S-box protein [Dehalococcoidales bacterium]